MNVNEVKLSTDEDFDKFYSLIHEEDNWVVKYNKNNTKVCSKWTDASRIKMIKVYGVLDGVTLECLYDVLHDPEYRRVWDRDMTDSFDICKLDNNNVIGWYGAKMPTPLKYRDWSTLRTWKKNENDFMIFNHSIEHKKLPVKKNFVRSISYVTGYYGKRLSATSSQVVFLSQTDPKGKLPKWFINMISTTMSPRVMKKLKKTALDYGKWKKKNKPNYKPWLDAQIDLPLLDPEDICPTHLVVEESEDEEFEEIDENEIDESNVTPPPEDDTDSSD